jgi:glycosyltransferase involved in cell wall biosynthesis
LNVALVSSRFAPEMGGLETHVRELATRLALRGFSVEVLTQTADRSLPACGHQDGFVVRRFPVVLASENYAVAPGLPLFLARDRPRYELIHAHNYHALAALGGALAAGGRPLVFTPHYHGVGHSPLRSMLHRPYRLAGGWLFSRSARVICVSHAEASLVIRHFPAIAPRIVVIPNGVDTSDLTAATPYDMRERVVLTVGRLERYKNVDAVIAAMSELDETHVLRIVGDGPDAARLHDRVAARGLGRRVELLGRLDRETLCRWYRTAAVYVNLSSQEAFGIGALEALAGGATVVLSDIPAHREVARRYAGDRGYVATEPQSPARLADAIATAARSRSLNGAAVALPSWDDVADETAELYLSAIGHRLPRRREESPQVA